MWVSYVNGTPKMSQIGSLIYGITLLQMAQSNMFLVPCSLTSVIQIFLLSHSVCLFFLSFPPKILLAQNKNKVVKFLFDNHSTSILYQP